MDTTITAKLKLVTTPEQFCQLRQTQLAYRDALNQVSHHAFAHGKTSNSQRLHHDLYDQVRTTHGLPSQMACSVFRQIGSTYKGLWTKWYKNVKARKAGWTRKRFKGLDKPPHFVSPTVTYVSGRDFTFKAMNQVSINTLSGRLVLPYQGWNRHVTWMEQQATIGGAKLWYDRAKHRFYLLVSLTIPTPDPTPEGLSQVLGVDLGQRYLATVTTAGNRARFYSGKQARAKADHYARVQKRLQRKDTRSATRRRIAIGQRERRFQLSSNHAIAKHILETYPTSLIGLEELSGIRECTRRRRKRRKGKQIIPVSPKARRANRHAARWAFAELRGLLTYKANLTGSVCIRVDADYTSQCCPRCGHTSRQNRPQHGLRFVCQQCQFTLHADLVGARNVCLRTLVVRQDWRTTGQLSGAPDGTDREAKAARLQKYAELRWSLVPSLWL
jgi:IS605 OrfB family transposase